jgi:hypothetical protein
MKRNFAQFIEVDTTWHTCHDRFDMQNVRDENEIKPNALAGDRMR